MSSKAVHTDYTDRPDSPGAYWMYDRAKKIYVVCNVVWSKDQYYVILPGIEGGMPIKDLDQAGNRWTFWGPLALPTGTGKIAANAVYEELAAPVEPQEEKS
jgi:hypothetical protein